MNQDAFPTQSRNYDFGFLNTNCMKAGACADPDCQAFLVGLHAIDGLTFQAMKEAFFGTADVPDAQVPARHLGLSVACASNVVATTPDFYNKENNDDLQPGIVPDEYPSTAYEGKRFSIALFRGVARMFEPDTYYFSKGGSGSPVHILFRAARGGADVYFANLSNIFPFVPPTKAE